MFSSRVGTVAHPLHSLITWRLRYWLLSVSRAMIHSGIGRSSNDKIGSNTGIFPVGRAREFVLVCPPLRDARLMALTMTCITYIN